MPQAVRAHARAVAVMMLVMAGAMLGMWLPIPGGGLIDDLGTLVDGAELTPRAGYRVPTKRPRNAAPDDWVADAGEGLDDRQHSRWACAARAGSGGPGRGTAGSLAHLLHRGWGGEAGQRFAVTTGGRDASGGAATRRGDGQAPSRPRRAGAAGGPARAPEQARRPALVEQPRPARGKGPPGDRARGWRRHRWSRRRAGHQKFRGQRAAWWSTCGASFFLAGPCCSARAGYSCLGAQRRKALGGRFSGGIKQRSHCERAGSRDSHLEQRDGLGMPSS